MITGCFQIVEAMRDMNLLYSPNRLDFDDYAVFHNQIGNVIPDQNVLVTNLNFLLLSNLQPCLCKLNRKCILINFFKESATKPITDLMGTADHLFSNLIQQ